MEYKVVDRDWKAMEEFVDGSPFTIVAAPVFDPNITMSFFKKVGSVEGYKKRQEAVYKQWGTSHWNMVSDSGLAGSSLAPADEECSDPLQNITTIRKHCLLAVSKDSEIMLIVFKESMMTSVPVEILRNEALRRVRAFYKKPRRKKS